MAASRAPRAGGSWSRALTDIAMSKDPVPKNVPPETQLIAHDEHTITIADKWPKAAFHLLVLPRIPFRLAPDASEAGNAATSSSTGKEKEETQPPKLSLAGGKLLGGTSKNDTVPASHLQDISSLLASPYAAQVLSALRTASEKAIEHIHEKMLQLPRCGTTWSIERAFHAIPSMQTVHLHVYSAELVSPALKNAKHYNSFRPGHGFALPLEEIMALIVQGKKTLPHSTAHYESLLKAALVGRDGRTYRNIPQLKDHLDEHWRAELAKIKLDPPSSSSKRHQADSSDKDAEDALQKGDTKRRRTAAAVQSK
ncbi:aprataxin-like protein [Tilletia horrida]|nr:aprataxin-like protein [Tilletia horrida]